jgi:hypothetical protein
LIPYAEYEHVFGSMAPCADGQYKVQVFPQEEGHILYVERAGRFNVEGCFGWRALSALVDSSAGQTVPELSHSQVQTLLGAIGSAKGFDIWIPRNDQDGLDWSLTRRFECHQSLPQRFAPVLEIMSMVDVVWVAGRSADLRALFEIEHSTRVYSGLLRLNDIYLSVQLRNPSFAVVAKDGKRDLFARQVSRPTFAHSGLDRVCNFHTYVDVFLWHERIMARADGG